MCCCNVQTSGVLRTFQDLEAHGCAKVEGALLRPRLLGRRASCLRSEGVGAVVGVHLHSRTLSVTSSDLNF